MQQATYQINVINPNTGTLTKVIDAASGIEIRYSKVLNGIGSIAITLPYSDDNWDAIGLDYFVEIRRKNPSSGIVEKEETYLVRYWEKYESGPETRIVIGGYSLNHLLTRRVIKPGADPLVAGGYTTKAGFATAVIRSYIREQAADQSIPVRRIIPGLSVPDWGDQGNTVGARLRFENLFEQVQDLARRGAIDFTIERTSGASMEVFLGVIGRDLTKSTNYPIGQPWIGLDPGRGNLTNPRFIYDRKDEKTVIITTAEGHGRGRKTLILTGVGRNDSPFNFIEFHHDAQNIERGDSLGLLTEATGELARHTSRYEFSFEPTGTEPGNIYKVDWDIGDKITATWGSDEVDIRITEIEMTISGDGEDLRITVKEVNDSDYTEDDDL